jgi:hypothetical protein
MDLLDLPLDLRLNKVLHLHCLDNEEFLALGHVLTHFDGDGNDGSGHRGDHTLGLVNLLGGCHMLVKGVLSGVEDCGLNLVALNTEVIVNLLASILELDKLALSVLVEAKERAILKVEAVGLYFSFLTCSQLSHGELSA